MKKLDTVIKKRGVSFTQVKRNDIAAIYKQVSDEGTFYAFEVFKIKKHNGFQVQGNQVAASEMYPGDNAFGVTAWSVKSIEKAEERFNAICAGKIDLSEEIADEEESEEEELEDEAA